MMRTYHIKTYTGSTPRRVIYVGAAYVDVSEGGFTPGYAGHTYYIPEGGAQIQLPPPHSFVATPNEDSFILLFLSPQGRVL